MREIFTAFSTILLHPLNRGKIWNTFMRIGWWKLNQLFFRYPAVATIAPGVHINCYPDDSYGSFIIYATWPEYQELHFIYSFLKKTDSFIDVGAHIGDSSLLAAAKIQSGQVLAIEPTPQIFLRLNENIRLNHFESRIIAVQAAISEKIGTAYFALESEAEVNHIQLHRGKSKSIVVPTTTIDALVKLHALDEHTFLKIDVEGFELEVLQGAKKSLRSQMLKIILFEVNPSVEHIHDKLTQIERILSENEYVFFNFTQTGQLSPLSALYVPERTDNFIAVTTKVSRSQAFKKWLS